MASKDSRTEISLDQISKITSFVVATDGQLKIVWASNAVLRRVKNVMDLKASAIFESKELSDEITPSAILRNEDIQHKIKFKTDKGTIPLIGRWILSQDGFVLLANPDVAKRENMNMFSFDDFPENDLTIELLTTREEHTESLKDAISAAKALREERDFAEILINTAHVIILMLDVEGRIVRFNTYLEDISGYSLDEVQGKDWFSTFIPEEIREKIRLLFKKALKGKQTRNNVNPIITKDGNQREIDWYDSTIMDNDGTIKGLLAVGQDLTKRRDLEKQLAQAQKLEAVGQLAAGIAHEINTPTQFVGDSIYFLREAFDDQRKLFDKYRQTINKVGKQAGNETLVNEIREAEEEIDLGYLDKQIPKSFDRCIDGILRISDIVSAMKEFAHPDQREKSAADINQALKATLTIARNEYKYVAEVETDLGDLPPIPCYVGNLNQVFLNLFVNAAHAIGDVVGDSGKKGVIRVRTAHEDNYVRIEIGDTGCGIPSEIQERIFDPFFTTKEVGKGSGQGLSIARSIVVDKHNGTLTVESEEGKGTTFVIRLPVSEKGSRTLEVV